MARVTPKTSRWATAAGRQQVVPKYKVSRVLIHANIHRMGTSAISPDGSKTPFQVCVTIGGRADRAHYSHSCGFGKNPRQAMSKALRELAGKMGKRKGAFAGLSKSKRRR